MVFRYQDAELITWFTSLKGTITRSSTVTLTEMGIDSILEPE